jgi:hypothetical protein
MSRNAFSNWRIPISLAAQPPEIDVQGANIQVRFDVPENAAARFCNVSRKLPAPAVAAD